MVDTIADRLLLVAQAIKPLKGLAGMDATIHEAIAALSASGVDARFENVAWHIGKSVEYIDKVYPDSKILDRGPIMRNMRRWHEQLTAALAQVRPARLNEPFGNSEQLLAAAPKVSEAVRRGGGRGDCGLSVDPPQADPAPSVAGEVVGLAESLEGFAATVGSSACTDNEAAILRRAAELLTDHARIVAELQSELADYRMAATAEAHEVDKRGAQIKELRDRADALAGALADLMVKVGDWHFRAKREAHTGHVCDAANVCDQLAQSMSAHLKKSPAIDALLSEAGK